MESRHFWGLKKAVGALRLFDRCPTTLPWFWYAHDKSDQGELTRLVLKIEGRDAKQSRAFFIFIAPVLWVLVSAQQLVSHMWRHRKVHRLYADSRGPLIQFFQILWGVFAENISVDTYYALRLFRPEAWRKRRSWIRTWQAQALFVALEKTMPEATKEANDKLAFWRKAHANALAVVPVLAGFENGRCTIPATEAPKLPMGVDLVLKPVNAYGGLGIEFFLSEGSCWRSGEHEWRTEEIIAHAAERSKTDGGGVLQQRIRNHPAIDPLSNGFLNTLRMFTVRFPNGKPSLLLACFRMTRGNAQVANLSGGPLIASIELATGKLRRAESLMPSEGFADTHPETSSKITDFTLPFWPQATELVLRAHSIFHEYPMIGWDVVISPSGPLLLELNTGSGAELLQLGENGPLGETAFPRCYLENYRALTSQKTTP